MMDANELNRLPSEEAPAVAEAETEVTPSATEGVEITYVPKQTRAEVIERLEELSQDPCGADKQELDMLKQTFYKLLKAEPESKDAPQGTQTEATAETSQTDDSEARFKEIMSGIKEKRNEMKAEDKKEKEDNVVKKLAIIDRLRALSESADDSSRTYQEFKKLQQEWNEIKNIPPARANELWRNFQMYAEKFYDLMKLNNEFREYDFRKNLEIKTRLCEAAEKLSEEPDVVSAFHQLQKLHQEFRSTGPVAKELREDIWQRFKTASSAVNRRHQQHFEALKEKEQTNLDEKTVICEIAEQMDYDKFVTFQLWEDKTQEILALQAKWKTIGYAPQKMNVKIFERFRAACDEFFRRKAIFYKTVKENMAANLEHKKNLCAQAEALKDSTDWKATADVLARLQKEWKEIGPVPKKHSDAVWKRFISACDYFFDQKNRASDSQRTVEQDNLILKRDLMEKLNQIDQKETLEEGDADTVRALMKEWNGIGHVPFKEKDRMYKQYHTLIDHLFERLNLSGAQKRLSAFKSGLSKGDNVYREREKLVRIYESMKNDIQTYENNLGFLTSSSKKGSSIVTDLQHKVEKLKSELQLVLQKIQAIDATLRNNEAEEKED
jgi:flagellar biosynthesis/type III secretory pathway chaperone